MLSNINFYSSDNDTDANISNMYKNNTDLLQAFTMNDVLYIINNYHKSGNLEMDAIKVKNVFINYNITEWNLTLQLQ